MQFCRLSAGDNPVQYVYMKGVIMKTKVSETLDQLDSLVNELKASSDEIGAIAIFVGTVRGKRGNEKVIRLEYEAHETLAPKAMKNIIEDAKAKYGLSDVIVEHRTGVVNVGEDVMYVLVASKHREEAFKAVVEIVNKVKHEVPIWKKEITEKGSYWIENH